MRIRELSLPRGWQWTQSTPTLYVLEPVLDSLGYRRAWHVEKAKRAKGLLFWCAVKPDEAMEAKLYRLRRGAEIRPFPT